MNMNEITKAVRFGAHFHGSSPLFKIAPMYQEADGGSDMSAATALVNKLGAIKEAASAAGTGAGETADDAANQTGITKTPDAAVGPRWDVDSTGFVDEVGQDENGMNDPLNKKPFGFEQELLDQMKKEEEEEGAGEVEEGDKSSTESGETTTEEGAENNGVQKGNGEQASQEEVNGSIREITGLRKEVSRLRERARAAETALSTNAALAAKAQDAYNNKLPDLEKQLRTAITARNKALIEEDTDAAAEADFAVTKLNRQIDRIEAAHEQLSTTVETANSEVNNVMYEAASIAIEAFPVLNDKSEKYDAELVEMINAVFAKNMKTQSRLDAFASAVESVLVKTGHATAAQAAKVTDVAKDTAAEAAKKAATEKRRDAASRTPASRAKNPADVQGRLTNKTYDPFDVNTAAGQQKLTASLGIVFPK